MHTSYREVPKWLFGMVHPEGVSYERCLECMNIRTHKLTGKRGIHVIYRSFVGVPSHSPLGRSISSTVKCFQCFCHATLSRGHRCGLVNTLIYHTLCSTYLASRPNTPCYPSVMLDIPSRIWVSQSGVRGCRRSGLSDMTYMRYLASSSVNSLSTVRSIWPVFCSSYWTCR